ncbi:MAG: hypothetical protein IJ180_01140 [Bacteroidales bacterium]|nr:hypothetical protein [Bacteroidales bacterium]
MKKAKQLTIIVIMILSTVFLSSCSKGEKRIVSKFSNDKPAIVHYIKNGKKVFEERFYPNGQMRSEGKWDGKNRTGVWKYYFDDGVVFAKVDFTDMKDGKDWQIWQGKNNKLVDKNDVINSMAFSNEGTLVTINIKKGDGEVFYRFFNSFKLMERVYLKGNIPQGESMTWWENGNINSEAFYKDGMQDSTYTVYAENGQKIILGHYTKGVKTGKWEYFAQNGQPQGIEIYDMDGTKLKDDKNDGLIYHRKPITQTDSTNKQ